MTESGKDAEGIPTNEEAVERLVEGLKETLEMGPKPGTSSDIPSPGPSVEKDVDLEEFKDALEEPPSSNEETDEERPDDFIDEEELKRLELQYTDTDKMSLKEEAEKFKLKGNESFRLGEYKDSAFSYTEGLKKCPPSFAKDRAVLYANRAAAKMKLELNESAIEDCSKALEYDGDYLKAVMRRAQLYERTEKLDEALADYNKVLQLDSSNREAYHASQRLPHEINERNEKMKTEMLGKLKDLGNMLLKPFGLSTNNFQMAQDPNTGGYSINFQQNSS